MLTVTFLTKPGCTMCDEALRSARRWSRLIGVSVAVAEIDPDHPDAERIPVLLDSAGVELAAGPWTGREIALILLARRLGRS